jgi:cytochrome c553
MPRAPRFYTIGDSALRVQACANCHGPGGRGEPPDYPYLAGQVRQYTIAALNEFRSGARNTDPSGQMQAIARKLRDADINVLATYLAALPAPPPAPTWSEARYVAPHFVSDTPIAGTREAEDRTNPVPK